MVSLEQINWITAQLWLFLVALAAGFLLGLLYRIYSRLQKPRGVHRGRARRALCDGLFMATAMVAFAGIWLFSTDGSLRAVDFLWLFAGANIALLVSRNWFCRRRPPQEKTAAPAATGMVEKRPAAPEQGAEPQKDAAKRPQLAERGAYRLLQFAAKQAQQRQQRQAARLAAKQQARLAAAEKAAAAEVEAMAAERSLRENALAEQESSPAAAAAEPDKQSAGKKKVAKPKKTARGK